MRRATNSLFVVVGESEGLVVPTPDWPFAPFVPSFATMSRVWLIVAVRSGYVHERSLTTPIQYQRKRGSCDCESQHTVGRLLIFNQTLAMGKINRSVSHWPIKFLSSQLKKLVARGPF